MNNGGGPACLRLRVVLSEDQVSAMQSSVNVLADEQRCWKEIEAIIAAHYPRNPKPCIRRISPTLRSMHVRYAVRTELAQLPTNGYRKIAARRPGQADAGFEASFMRFAANQTFIVLRSRLSGQSREKIGSVNATSATASQTITANTAPSGKAHREALRAKSARGNFCAAALSASRINGIGNAFISVIGVLIKPGQMTETSIIPVLPDVRARPSPYTANAGLTGAIGRGRRQPAKPGERTHHRNLPAPPRQHQRDDEAFAPYESHHRYWF